MNLINIIFQGVSLYAGGFPNESEVIDLISNGEWDALKLVILLY